MKQIAIKRIDHLGLVAGVMQDLNLIDEIDNCLPGDQKVSTGRAIAAMVLNGLGFTDRPLSLTAEFFEEIAVSRLLQDSLTSEDLNRHRLGRCLDDVSEYGVSRLFSEIASSVALKEGVSRNTQVIDTTSFSVSGKKYDDTDENEVLLCRGYSKDHRPDLMQVISELVVSTDGGIPLTLLNHDGNSSDSKIFRERCMMLGSELSKSDGRLIADSKLYTEENMDNLKKFSFITRIPETNKESKKTIQKSVQQSEWQEIGENYFVQAYNVNHFDLDQKWMVFYSKEGLIRAQKSMQKKVEKEYLSIVRQIKTLETTDFSCRSDAECAVQTATKKWKFHSSKNVSYEEKSHYKGAGRPKNSSAPDSFSHLVRLEIEENQIEEKIKEKACFIIGTNEFDLNPTDLLKEYKSQGAVERGFRFLKNPSFFTSSFFLKKPSRIDALIGIMSISLLVYAISERRLRAAVLDSAEAFHDPVYGKTKRPTMKRIMQMMLNINEVYIELDGQMQVLVTGVTDLRRKIILMISNSASDIYSLNQN